MNRYNFRGNIVIDGQGNIAPVGSNIEISTLGNLNIGNISAPNIHVGNLVLSNISVPLIPNSGTQIPYRHQRQSGTATGTILATPPVGTTILGYFGMIHDTGSLQYYPIAKGSSTNITDIFINGINQLQINGTFVAEPYDLTILISQ